MLKAMNKYPSWKILTVFLESPTKTSFVWQITRDANISSFTSSIVLRELWEEGILERAKKGKFVFYTLKNNPLTRELKKTYSLAKLYEMKFVEEFLNVDKDMTLALIGSYASGEHTEKSALELLCITEKSEFELMDTIEKLKGILKVEITLKTYPKQLWKRVQTEEKTTYENILRNHILLCGNLENL